MDPKLIVVAIISCLLVGCSHRDTATRRLESGKEVQVIESYVIDDSFIVEYCTDLPFSDRRVLGSEADEVFHSFRGELARSAKAEASMWPTVCRWELRWSGWKPVILTEQSTDFTYVRSTSGDWTRQN